ncbi:AP-4 complex subunit epsilon [Acrasis kona]|uniref:AP-4 complex subunit epsilon n=1 Tax=Acrasis kona TaxID=1008807 RepID=A0AAW2YSE6_9EUKA
MANQTHTKEFFELIRNIGETKSKQEEDKIIIKEIATLKQHFQNDKSTLKVMKEYMVRALYCEMLGHEASFSYFQATKLTSSKSVLEKRVGYLSITLCVPKDHELVLLLIANLQNDLLSTNYLIVCAALTAASKLVNEETIPALLPSVLQLRKHKNPIVRKKIIALLHTFYLIQKDSIPSLMEYAKEALCDQDPSVMGVSMCLFHDLCKDERNLPELKASRTNHSS